MRTHGKYKLAAKLIIRRLAWRTPTFSSLRGLKASWARGRCQEVRYACRVSHALATPGHQVVMIHAGDWHDNRPWHIACRRRWRKFLRLPFIYSSSAWNGPDDRHCNVVLFWYDFCMFLSQIWPKYNMILVLPLVKFIFWSTTLTHAH